MGQRTSSVGHGTVGKLGIQADVPTYEVTQSPELLDQLVGIAETVLIFASTGGRPKLRRMLTETTPTQDHLSEIFDLKRYAPRAEPTRT